MSKAAHVRVSFIIPSDKLSTFIDVISQEVTDLDIKQVDAGKVFSSNAPRKIPRSASGSNPGGDPRKWGSFKTMFAFMKSKGAGAHISSKPEDAAGKYLAANGLAATSASSTISRMTKMGYFRKVHQGIYEIIKWEEQ